MNVYEALADLVALVHLAYVGFVGFGMVLILVGILRKWQWVQNFWFRIVHFLMIAVVAAEALGGVTCPLTTWENLLRQKAGGPASDGSFVGGLVRACLFIEAPHWVLTICYCVFGLTVLITLILAPPRWPWRKKTDAA